MLLAACGNEATSNSPVREYAPRLYYLAPDFELKQPDGSALKLSSFKGKPVLINFWATWCAPCRVEMPEIASVYQQYKKDGLVVLGVNIKDELADVKKYIEDGGYSWPILMDYDSKVKDTYQVTGYPFSLFVDREGFIRAMQVGGMDKKGLEERLLKIL